MKRVAVSPAGVGVGVGAAVLMSCIGRRLFSQTATVGKSLQKGTTKSAPKSTAQLTDIEILHEKALQHGEETYQDPATGYTCFTAIAHNKRGYCCGSRCRHCPYGHRNVGKPDSIKADKAEAAIRKKEGKKAKASVYTRTGDSGSSGLYNGERRKKTDLVFEAMGNVDELNCVVGMALEICLEKDEKFLGDILEDLQGKLMDVGSSLATPAENSPDEKVAYTHFPIEMVKVIEDIIDDINSKLEPCRAFILPTGGKLSCQLHLARTVCRRAERSIVRLNESEPQEQSVVKYINRLSDLFFVMARYAAKQDNREDVWRPKPCSGNPKPYSV
eukprot:TRINITY_DN19674_c0_g1_i1.p1 TRINITY_DN19674_c0_g1~~TRINITY_DN19674_c0_g1_i1.p1  ORF type:complete len:330 (+),score=51.67 TRINITY_DN19674_c0_g1_i1:67-1056(+)